VGDLSELKAVTVGWVSLSKSGKSQSIKVLNQNQIKDRAEVKQWIEQEQPEQEEQPPF